MGVSRSIGGDGLSGDPSHWSIHKEAENKNMGEGCLLACIFTVYGGGENDGDKSDGALVGSKRSK